MRLGPPEFFLRRSVTVQQPQDFPEQELVLSAPRWGAIIRTRQRAACGAMDQHASIRVGSGRRTMADRALKILVVEDHTDTSRLMARLLQGNGHQVRTADGVHTALTAAGQED